MKKSTIFIITALLLTAGAAFGKEFRPLSIKNYSIEVPDDTALPDRENLVLAQTRAAPTENPFVRLKMFLYKNPNELHFDTDTGEFLFPYMEVAADVGNGTSVLITVSWINAEMQLEVYENKTAFGSSDTKEMLKVEHFKQRNIKKIND